MIAVCALFGCLASVTGFVAFVAYRVGQHSIAHLLARDLRHRANRLQTYNCYAEELAGMRYAADLIDRRRRTQ